MIIDTDQITKLLLEENHSIYSIAKEIGVTRSTLNVYRQKQDKNYIKEMSLDLAMKLQNYINQEEKGMTKYIVLRDLLDENGDPYDNEEELKTDNYEKAKKVFEDLVKQIKSYDQKRNGTSLMELNEFEEYETLECYVY